MYLIFLLSAVVSESFCIKNAWSSWIVVNCETKLKSGVSVIALPALSPTYICLLSFVNNNSLLSKLELPILGIFD